MVDRTDWIIAKCNTSLDGIDIYRFYASKEEVKERLVSMVLADKEQNDREWDGEGTYEFGTENVEYVKDVCNGHEFYAFGSYSDYHIDYTAKEFSHVYHMS